MLVLTVKEGDYIMIDDDIRIEFIQDVTNKSLRVGIEAPKTKNIARGKIYEKKILENPNSGVEKLEEIRQRKEQAKKAARIRHAKEAQRENIKAKRQAKEQVSSL